MHVYTVKARIKWITKGTKEGFWQQEDPIWVLANGDARKAVEKAEKYFFRRKDRWEDDKGNTRTNVCTRFELVSVTCDGEIDVR